MVKGKNSGLVVNPTDVPVIMGMIERGDRHHDIAAWFGLNQGRIKDTQDGKYGPPVAVSGIPLPPKGPPGLKGRRLREAVEKAQSALTSGDATGAVRILKEAKANYDANEV